MKKLFIIPLFSLLIFSACGQAVPLNDPEQTASQNGTPIVPPPATGDYTEPQDGEITDQQPEIFVETPQPGETVSSPLTLKGKAMGNWFFEGVLPVSMEDSKGNLLSAAPARALSDWMTEDYVEFEATLTFDSADNQTATITIKNDNPSGLPENSKKFMVPVKLAPAT